MATGSNVSAVASALGEGERWWFVGTLATIRVPGSAVGGRFDLAELLFPRHASPPLHTHPVDETFVVLEGRLTVVAAGRRFVLEAGGTGAFPAGVAHTFRVDSDTARALVLSTPSGLERLYREAGVAATAPTLPPADTPRPSPEEMQRIFERQGQINLGPPLGPDD
jgi:quercetin dioxygenase-like cupin family protein